MEGMVSKEFEQQHEAAYQSGRSRLFGKAWVRHLVERLLEFTHGIWIYRNALMHDNVSGLLASERKEELLKLIAEQRRIAMKTAWRRRIDVCWRLIWI